MNILYIDHYAGSLSMGMEFRPYYLAREWKKAGHNVRILAASFSHLRTNNPKVKKDFSLSVVDGIEYQWVKTISYSGNGISRILTMLQFCWKIYKNAEKLAKDFKPDIVIASSTYPMDAYAANKIAQKSGGRYVHEVHDMWPVILTELYHMSTKNPFFAIVQHAEDYFCKNADKVVSILPCTKDYFIEHGMCDDKFVYIPNGVALTDWEVSEQLPDEHLMVLSKAHDEGKFIVVFFGSHAKQCGPDSLIKALKNLDQSKVFVAFVGDGNYKKELIMLADRLNISKESYIFLPRISKKAIPSLLKKSDASYIGAIKSRMFSFGTSQNKIFDAMMGGKPIIYAVDAPNDFAREYSCGVSVAAEDIDALREGIVFLMDMSERARKELGNNGRNAILKNFTYDVLADKFINGITQ